MIRKGAHMNNLLTIISAVALLTAIAGSAYAQKTVFVTSATCKSNLGGLAGADDKCQAEADDAASIVPSGTYLAWLTSPWSSYLDSFSEREPTLCVEIRLTRACAMDMRVN